MIPLIEPCHAHFKPCLVKLKLELVHIQCFFSCGNCGMHCMHCQKWAGRANPLSVSWGRQILLLLFFQSCCHHFQALFCCKLQPLTTSPTTSEFWRWHALHSGGRLRDHALGARQSAGLPSRPAAEDLPCTFLLTTLLISGHANLTLRLLIDFLFIPQFRHMASVHSLQEMISLFFSSFKVGCEKLMLMFQGQRKSGQVWDY